MRPLSTFTFSLHLPILLTPSFLYDGLNFSPASHSGLSLAPPIFLGEFPACLSSGGDSPIVRSPVRGSHHHSDVCQTPPPWVMRCRGTWFSVGGCSVDAWRILMGILVYRFPRGCCVLSDTEICSLGRCQWFFNALASSTGCHPATKCQAKAHPC